MLQKMSIHIAISIFLIVTGCQTTKNNALGHDAVMCSKCKTSWVRLSGGSVKNNFHRYQTKTAMSCPKCESAVANYFKTGNWEHTCETCGDSLEKCNLSQLKD